MRDNLGGFPLASGLGNNGGLAAGLAHGLLPLLHTAGEREREREIRKRESDKDKLKYMDIYIRTDTNRNT